MLNSRTQSSLHFRVDPRDWFVNWISIQENTITGSPEAVLSAHPETVLASEQGLTAFAETATVADAKDNVPLAIERSISNPWSVLVPKELLCRMYEVAQVNWTGAHLSVQVAFPGVFLTIPTIVNVMKSFAVFRATIHVEIKMNSTPYHQGSLVAAWIPCQNNLSSPTDVYTLTGSDNAQILSASQQDSCSFDIPYLHPLDWLVWPPSSPVDASIAILNIQSVTELLSSSSAIAVSIPITVFAGFKDIEVTAFVAHSGKGSKFTTNTEAHSKQKAGLDVKSTVSTVSKIARRIPVVGEAYGGIADFMNMAFGTDLSKPNNQSATTYTKERYMDDVTMTTGLNDAYPLSLYPNPQITQAPKMFGMDTSHVPISKLAQRPMLFFQTTLTGGSPTYSLAGVGTPMTLDPIFGGRDWLGFCAQAHHYWRGSIKYLVHFVCPAFYSFRVQVMLFYSPTAANVGDIVSRIIDVKGDTWEEFLVPYLYPTTWMNLDTGPTLFGGLPKMVISIITGIVGSSSPAAAVVPIEIYRAGGEDTEFAGMRNASDHLPSMSAQCALGSKFSKQFKSFNSGVAMSFEKGNVMSEISGTVSDALKKASQAMSTTTSFPGVTSVAVTCNEPYYYWARCFLFWRGGRIIRHMHPTTGGTLGFDGFYLNSQNTSTNTTISTGWAPLFVNAQAPILNEEVYVHYLCAQPYYPILPSTANVIAPSCYTDAPTDFLTNSASLAKLVYAGADDYLYLYPFPFFRSFVQPLEKGKILATSSAKNAPVRTVLT